MRQVIVLVSFCTALLGCDHVDNASGESSEVRDHLDKKLSIIDGLLQKFDQVRREMSTSTTPDRELLLNGIEQTTAALKKLRGYLEGYGFIVPEKVTNYSGIQRPDVDSWLFSPDYWETMQQALSGHGYVESGNLLLEEVMLVNKSTLTRFPSDALLVRNGLLRGLFSTPEGDLLVPGISFYRGVTDGRIDPDDFGRVEFHARTVHQEATNRLKAGDLHSAVQQFKMLTKQPASSRIRGLAWHNIGYYYHENGDLDAALPAYNEAVALEPMARSFLQRARVHRDMKQHDLSEADLKRALELEQDPEKQNMMRIILRHGH